MAPLRSVLLPALCLLAVLSGATAVTKRTAYAAIKNNLQQKLRWVQLIHKYSDDYTEDVTVVSVKGGELRKLDETPLHYHTGALTTGRDWWYLAFQTPRGKVCYSDPMNFRGILDFVERVGPELVKAGADAVAESSPEPRTKAAAVIIKGVTAAAEASGLLNKGKTAGFKQHILRTEDAWDKSKRYVEFHINAESGHDKLSIISKSGTSKTKLTCKDTPKSGRKDRGERRDSVLRNPEFPNCPLCADAAKSGRDAAGWGGRRDGPSDRPVGVVRDPFKRGTFDSEFSEEFGGDAEEEFGDDAEEEFGDDAEEEFGDDAEEEFGDDAEEEFGDDADHSRG